MIDPYAAWGEIQGLRPEGNGFSLTLFDADAHRSLLPILVGGSPAGFLVMARGERAEPLHQVVVHHLATAIALDLSKTQAVAATWRPTGWSSGSPSRPRRCWRDGAWRSGDRWPPDIPSPSPKWRSYVLSGARSAI